MTSVHGTKWSTKNRPPTEGAAVCLPAQLPIIGKAFPEILGAYPATLNVMLMQPLLVLGSDHRTAPIDWLLDGKTVTEVFDLVRIELEVRGSKHRGWIYIAHLSPHRHHLASHEIVLPSKIDVQDGEPCIINISRSCKILPNGNRPVIVVS
jgi:hypothetical protein